MKKIYVVMGTSGEYSDRDEWPVKAYIDEEKAKTHVVKASERAREIEIAGRGLQYAEQMKLTKTNEFDPDMDDYYGVSYFFYEVKLDEL